MGVPKFYRWISERYPKINQIVSDNALLPEVDHLYLDLNGIIHGCTHPSHLDVASEVLSEREMMLGIMHYLDRIITQIVKPKVSVYMAIDGVAPRAKLNQQRSRRFRSAKDLAEATKDLPRKQDNSNNNDGGGSASGVFDSNCITPGTEFLDKVSKVIQYFIRKKIKEDPLWHHLTVIFSGHDIPGEGEHKIMQHIREMRSSPNYPPNTRHCIYGQDADLIMLALVTHEPHFVILREVVDFSFSGFQNKNALKQVKKFTKESDFQLLHISVLREYLQIEFCRHDGNDGQQQQQQQQYDLERVIDDFVFMTFLVGNDFLPHMPTLDIGDGAFDLLFEIYKEQRQSWGEGNYLTQSGTISDPKRLEAFLAAVGAVESEILEQREKDEAIYIKKKRKWDRRDGKEEGPSDAELKRQEADKQNDYMSMIESMMAKQSLNGNSDEFVDGWQPVTEPDQKDFKGRYYFEKLKLKPVDKEEHWALRKAYMEGLVWCLAYYYQGCVSWGWFYPYHYGPMLSDLVDVPKMFDEIKFDLGEPLTPFQQLMGCLPPASSELVPRLYRWLMTSTDSPIVQFYPQSFEVDMNGKKNPWEGVNLLPFIEVNLLKDTIATNCPPSKLSADERRRNSIGKVYCYRYDVSCMDTVESPNKKIGLPDIVASNCCVSVIDEQETSGLSFKPELIPGTQIPYPGFPSLNVLPIASAELVRIGLNCFGSPSKYPTMLLSLYGMPELPPLEALAENVLGQSLFVNWPMMHEGRVVAVSDETKEIKLVRGKKKTKEHDIIAAERWQAESGAMRQIYHTGNGVPGSGGVEIGDIKVRLKLLPLQGMKSNPANGSTKKLFGREEAEVPLQLCLWQAPAPDPRFVERGPMTLEERFPEGSNVVLTKGKYRGCIGSVVGIADTKNVGVKVLTYPVELPFGLAIARSVQESYISSVDAARILKMHPALFGKVTGRLQFEQGKYDLGLNLKSADGACVIGYTRRKVDNKVQKGDKPNVWNAGDSLLVVGSMRTDNDEDNEERIQWEYTPNAIRLVESYRQKFPQLFAELRKLPNERKYDANKVFGPNGEAWLPVIRQWLNDQESAKLPRSPVTTQSMSHEAVAAVQKAADVRSLALKKSGYPKESLIKIPGPALYREGSTGATDVLLASDLNNSEGPQLGDRVVNLCADGIPFGAKGTVVAIHEASTTGSVEVVMDEEFIGGSSLQGACSNFRGKLCRWAHLLKVAPDNSKKVVDKLVPKGTGRAAVDKIISKMEREAKINATTLKSSYDSQVDAATRDSTPAGKPASPEPGRAKSKAATPSRQTGRAGSTGRSTSRAGSTGRGRQGAWKEARGPAEKGIGFKGARKGKSGVVRWKGLVKSNAVDSSDKSSAELKAILGVTPGAESSPTSQPSSNAELKAMLGVSPAPDTSPKDRHAPLPAVSTSAAAPGPDASAGLKAMLGVSSERSTPQPAPQQKSQATAADKLLQFMANKQTAPPAPVPVPNRRSSFNFTYVEEGKEQLPSTKLTSSVSAPVLPSIPSPYPGYPPMPMPPPGTMPMPQAPPMQSPYGTAPPPPPHHGYPSPHGLPPQGPIPRPHPMAAAGGPPPPPASATATATDFSSSSSPLAVVGGQLSSAEFPPLGATEKAPQEGGAPKQAVVVVVQQQEPQATAAAAVVPSTTNLMVPPSVVAKTTLK